MALSQQPDGLLSADAAFPYDRGLGVGTRQIHQAVDQQIGIGRMIIAQEGRRLLELGSAFLSLVRRRADRPALA